MTKSFWQSLYRPEYAGSAVTLYVDCWFRSKEAAIKCARENLIGFRGAKLIIIEKPVGFWDWVLNG